MSYRYVFLHGGRMGELRQQVSWLLYETSRAESTPARPDPQRCVNSFCNTDSSFDELCNSLPKLNRLNGQLRITERRLVRCWNIQRIIERGHVNVNKARTFFVVANNRAIVLQEWNITFVSGGTCSACGEQNIYSLTWSELDTHGLAFGTRSCTSAITNCSFSTSVGVLHCVDHHFWCGHMCNSASFDLFYNRRKNANSLIAETTKRSN